MNKIQKNIGNTSFQPKHEQINLYELSQSKTIGDNSINSPSNISLNDRNQIKKNKTLNKSKYCPWSDDCSCFTQGLIIGSLLAGLILAIIVALWWTGTKSIATSSTEASNFVGTSGSSTSATTITTTTRTTTTTVTTTSTAAPICATLFWNSTGVTVAGISGMAGSAVDRLNEPWNIYIDQTNNYLYIADSKNHRVQLWLPGAVSGTTVAGTGTQGSTPTQLNTPKDVFVDSSKNLYVADSLNQRIQFFPNGSTTGITVSSSWSSPGELWGVQVVAGSIYACDKSKPAVWKNGSVIAGTQAAGSGSNQLNQPQGFAVDTVVAPGTVYVANTQQHSIVRWAVGATTGTVVAGFSGSLGSTPTLLAYPVAIKLDTYSNMFVADNNNNRIQLFCRHPTINMTGRTIAGTGVSGTTPQTLKFPAGLALDASLNLYVADTSNHRVQKFQRLY